MKKMGMYFFFLAVFLPCWNVSCETKDLIEAVIVKNNRLTVIPDHEFAGRFLMDDFFVEYEKEVDLEKLPRSLVLMPFIALVISTVWISGEDYYIDQMDCDFYQALERLKKIFKVLYPKTPWEGRLIPRKLVSTPKPELKEATHIALLFSGGLDSTVSSLFHSDKKQLLISAWGHSGLPLERPGIWNKAKKGFLAFAQQYGHEFSSICSNYATLFNWQLLSTLSPEISKWRAYAIEDVGWAGLTAPLLYVKGYPVLHIASSNSWESGYPVLAHPYVDSVLSFAGIHLEHDLFDYSRQDKIAFLASYYKKAGISPQELIVCPGGIPNCCNCSKCLSTALGLIVIGEDPAKYGFLTPRNMIIERSRMLLLKDMDSTRIERFKAIQDVLIRSVVPSDLEWLAHVDFAINYPKTHEYRFQQRISWKSLHALFPEVSIPQKYLL